MHSNLADPAGRHPGRGPWWSAIRRISHTSPGPARIWLVLGLALALLAPAAAVRASIFAQPGFARSSLAEASSTGSKMEAQAGLRPSEEQPSADLAVFKDGPSSADSGADVTYTVTISNGGPDAASNAAWTDTLPGDMTFVSLDQVNGPTFNCTTPDAGDGGTITCTIATLPSGESAEFTLVAHIPGGAAPATAYTNIATISSSTLDPNEENNSSPVATFISSPYADLSVQKTGPISAAPGTNVTYNVTISNGGPDAASKAEWTDTLPGDMTFVSLKQENGPTFSCTTPAVDAGGTVTCSISELAVGAGAEFTLVAHIPAETFSGTEYTNTAAVSSSTPDPNEENDNSSITTTVGAADMSVEKNGPVTATAGENITYTIALANSGPDFASDATLTDVLPSGLTFVSLTQNSGPVFSCTSPSPGMSGTITCGTGVMAADTSAQFTLVARASSALTGATNTATVSSSTADTDTSDNSSSVTTTFIASADLTVNKTAPVTVTAGSNINYSIALTNTGPSDARSVTLVDTLPVSTTFVSLAQTSGPAFSCGGPGGGAVTCTADRVSAGASARFSLTLRADPGLRNGDVITNTAVVDATTADPNSRNNSSVVTSTVATVADLGIAKTHTGSIALGEVVTYVITATNSGPSVAYGALVTDTFQSGLTGVSYSCRVVSGARSRCYTASGVGDINATVDLDVNGAVVFTATALVTNPTSTLQNTAYISLPAGRGTDPDPSNNSSTDVANVPPTATSTATATATGTSTATSTPTRTATATSTATSSPTATSTGTATGTSTATGTPTRTATGTAPATSSPTATSTATGTATSTAISTGTPAATGTSTATSSPAATSTAAATGTSTAISTGTPTATSSTTSTGTATATGTAAGTSTATNTVSPNSTATSSSTATATATQTPAAAVSPTVAATATATATPSATRTQVQTFIDVPPGFPFYSYVECLAARDIISGYDDSTYRPYNPITRGQIAKVVSLAAGFTEDPGAQIYSDVPPEHPFYAYINRLTNRGIVGGYPCPQLLAPLCTPESPRLFRPEANATRGQLAKIVSNAAGFDEPVSGQHYADVPPAGEGSQFYEWIMRLTSRGVIGGYTCGTSGPTSGPCDAENRPYFRPANDVTRGQAAKIVANTFFPGCETASRK